MLSENRVLFENRSKVRVQIMEGEYCLTYKTAFAETVIRI